MENKQYKEPQHYLEDEDEIDFIALAKTLWEGRRVVIKTTLIFMALGLFIAIFSQKEYTATTIIVPQTSKKAGGSLSGLAAMAGINLGNMGGSSEISPTLYPQIVNSIPFQKELLQTLLTIEGQNQQISFTDYYTEIYSPGLLSYLKKYTIGLPGVIINALKGKPTPVTLSASPTKSFRRGVERNKQLLSITNEENGLIKRLSSQILLDVNAREGFLTLSVNMPQALAAAELTQKTQELLQRYIIDFKIKKSTEQLKFIQ